MSLATLLARDVEVWTATFLTDRDNNQVPAWSHRDTVKGWLSQTSRSEDLHQRHAEISSWHLTLDVDCSPLRSGDRVVVDGQTFEVDGPPNMAWTPRGAHHIEATLKVVEG